MNEITKERRDAIRVEHYQRMHDAAIAEYEAATPTGYRYSATALRRAVDKALSYIDALDAAEAKMGEPVACGGCGASDPESRCIGCLHDFYAAPPVAEPVKPLEFLDPADDEAFEWVRKNATALRTDGGSMLYGLTTVIRAYQAGKAALAAEPVIPEDWVLVPREPTQEQAEAGRAAHTKRFPEEPISDISAAEILRAGIAAAPALVSEKEAE